MNEDRIRIDETALADDSLARDTWRSVYESEPECPELALWRAIVERAIQDAAGNLLRKHRSWQTQALVWIRSKSKEPMSFEAVCEVLDLNPEAVRRRILTQTKGQSS